MDSKYFLFQTVYEVVASMRDSFTNFTSTVLETLASEAPSIGSDNKKFNDKVHAI